MRLLSHVAKFYEIIIFNQISTYSEPYFSSFHTGFRKNNNTQHSLLKILELWKKALDNRNSVGAIFMDLSKAFDTLNHDLLKRTAITDFQLDLGQHVDTRLIIY